MPKRKPSEFNYPADLVWAAASAAYRINGGYFKYPEISAEGRITRPSNRELVQLYLADSSHQFITATDYQQARACRQDLLNTATMAALKLQASEWNLLSAKMASLETVTTEYEVAVIAAMPKSHAQNLDREKIDNRLAFCESDLLGPINQLISTSGEVVRCNYSAKYNTFYVTVITDSNHQVFFAYREAVPCGTNIGFSGRVKRHADRATQLSRVKLIKQEAA